MQVTKFLQWFVIRVQDESFALEVLVEEVHPPYSGGSFKYEGRVVHFVILELLDEIAWKFPSLSTFVRMAPRPPGMSAVPIAASVISAYCQSDLGKAITGSEVSCF